MPNAVVKTDTEHFDLKTLPEAYVELRRMSFGEKNKQMSLIGSQMEMKSDQKTREVAAIMNFASEKSTAWQFANLIVDHNLEDADGRKLNFSNQHDLDRLDPRVGEEIAVLIDGMNNFSEADLGNSQNGSTPQ
jgi:hypothetical protein